jgi:AraC-like DNA-binding protein
LTEKDMARLNRGVATVLRKGLFSVEETLAHLDAALERKRKLSADAQRLVRQAMAYLHEHYAETITREDLARHVGFSDSGYFSRVFRREVGLSPEAFRREKS